MAFDLATAKPVTAQPPKFDLSTAKPVEDPAAVAAEPSTWDSIKDFASKYGPQAGPEAVASMASGIVATPAAGIAGIGAAATNALGLTDMPAADVVNSVQGAMTYEPRTKGGKAVLGAASYPFEKLAQLGDAGGDLANHSVPSTGAKAAPVSYSPGSGGWPMGGADDGALAATAINTGIQALPSLLLDGARGKLPARVAEIPKPKPQLTPRQALVDELIAKKLKVTPTQVGAGAGSTVEGLTGHAKLERSLSKKNAPRVNELVGEDIGLKDAKSITQGDLARLKTEANRPYAEISKMGERKTSTEYKQEIASIGDRTGGESFKGDVPPDITKLKDFYSGIKKFTASDAVNKVRQLRSEATQNIKARNAPEQNAKGHVQRAIADAIDNELARHVDELGKPELAAKYKAARVQLAKIHTVEDALRGSNVSAKALAAAKKRGAPLRGNMELVAKAHAEFDRAFQDVGKIRDSSPFGVLDLGAGLAGAVANPALLAAVLARPAARAALTSDWYQRGLASGSKGSAVAAAEAAPKASAIAPKNVREEIAAQMGRK